MSLGRAIGTMAIVGLLLITCLSSPMSLPEESLKGHSQELPEKSLGHTLRAPIRIYGNSDFIAANGVVSGNGSPSDPNMVRPTALVPFAINAEVSKQKYLEWLKKLWFRPGDLKRTASQAGVSGVYAPFFTFDAQAESDWNGWRGTYYYTTETYTVTVDGRPQTRTRQVQHTRWSYHSGHNSQFYNDILVNASSGLPEDILKKIYPFNLNGLIGYSTEFLAGFSAEEYTRNPANLWMTARQVMASSERDACSRALNGDTQRGLRVNTQLNDPKWKHILLPVFVSSYLYRGKRYNFLVNGQTGEVQGEAPLSWAKIGGLIAAVAGIIGGVVLLGQYLGWF